MNDRYVVESIEDKSNKNFTQVLWDAIRTTGKIGWVKKTRAAPATKNWAGWLAEAVENCGNMDWDCEGARDRWMAKKLEVEEHKTEDE